MVSFEYFSRPLLFLHLLAAIAACGSAIHLFLRFWSAYRGRRGHFHIARLHSTILLISYTCCLVLAILVYPTFRVRVRHEYLDKALPWATAMFEIKEHLAALTLLPVIGVWLFHHRLNLADDPDRRYIPLVLVLLALVMSTLAYNSVYGWYLGQLRPL